VTSGPPGWPVGGVHRVLGPAASVAAELAGRGWDVAVVPASTTDDALWDGLVDALRLPDWFGRNLDALDEAFSDLRRPTALVFAGWTVYARARPERWHRLLHVLQDWACHPDSRIVVLLTD
jgi:RNAse (barnase) inhibitor barstar